MWQIPSGNFSDAIVDGIGSGTWCHVGHLIIDQMTQINLMVLE